jgi:hypothetical protein
MTGILDEIGMAGAGLAYVSPSTGMLTSIDGHLRKSLADVPFPTLILDLDDVEADLLLTSYDPLGALAEANRPQLAALLQEVQSGNAGLQQMLAQLAEREGIVPPDFQPVGVDTQGRLDQKATITCPACGHEFAL